VSAENLLLCTRNLDFLSPSSLFVSYDNLVWDASLGTAFATIGFNSNIGQFYSLPGSNSLRGRQISCGGVSENGCYTFRVDGAAVQLPVSGLPSVTPSTSPMPSPTQKPSAGLNFILSPSYYSGSGPARDPCAHSLTALYAFGAAVPDASERNASGAADSAFRLSLPTSAPPFMFFGKPYVDLFPSVNGAIFMGAPSEDYLNVPFPAKWLAAPIIAPWWADVSVTDFVRPIPGYNSPPNSVYYRVSGGVSNEYNLGVPYADAARMARDVNVSFPDEAAFSAASMAVVTWFAVGSKAFATSTSTTDNNGIFYIEEHTDALNTFQAAIASDSSGRTFVTLW
jgi:hypothetical protein